VGFAGSKSSRNVGMEEKPLVAKIDPIKSVQTKSRRDGLKGPATLFSSSLFW
jgi:hypothetical protein